LSSTATLAGNERSDEVAQPMAEPFTEWQESVGSLAGGSTSSTAVAI